MEEKEIVDAINAFLASLSPEKRKLFVSRYWAMTPIREIARENEMTESNVKTILHRTRKQLRTFLEQEGISI